MPPRPRSASLPARDTSDDWARPGSWGGRKPAGSEGDVRSSKAQLSSFEAPSFAAHTQRTSRTLDALDLATPRVSPKHATLPSFKAVATAMKAAGGSHGLDAHALAGALGGDKKLAANIEKRMQAHKDKHEALMNNFMSKGFSALHTAPAQAMKDVNKQLSAMQAHKKPSSGSAKPKK